MSDDIELDRPWDLWLMIILTILAGIGAIFAIPDETDTSLFLGIMSGIIGVIWLILAYGFYTLKPIARTLGIILNLFNVLFELALAFVVEDRGYFTLIFIGILGAIYIGYLQYRKDLFIGR